LKDTCIIILNEDKAVYMIVEKVAFKYVEGVTFSTKILQEFIGSIIVCDNLQKKVIKKIFKQKLYGNTFWLKFYSFILGRYTLKVEYEYQEQISIGELKKILIKSLKENMNISLSIILFGKSKLKEDTKIIINGIEKAVNYQEILYTLGYNKGDIF
jgi:hypothetical protein